MSATSRLILLIPQTSCVRECQLSDDGVAARTFPASYGTSRVQDQQPNVMFLPNQTFAVSLSHSPKSFWNDVLRDPAVEKCKKG